MNFQISLGQMDVQYGNPSANLETVKRMSEEAKRLGSDILLLPELWSTGYDLVNASRFAAGLGSGLFASLSALARQVGICIIGSTLSIVAENKYANTLTVFDSNGSLLEHYSKIHLFRLMDEDQYLEPGNEIKTVNLPIGKAGLAICYDLRFPEMFRALALAGADMIFLPSEWPQPRLAHWQTLVKARAIENQLFMFACNRVGSDASNTYFGHSMVVDPWGDVQVEGGEREELLTTSIDLTMLADARSRIPIFRDRRPDVYP